MTITTSLLALGAIAFIALSSAPSAVAHPHDLLGQCQMKDGSWRMCSETIHDLAGAHVPKEAPVAGGSLTTTPKPERTRTKSVQ